MPRLQFLSPLHKASRQIAVHLEARCGDQGVSTTEGHLLTYLASYAPCPIGEVRRVFGLKGSTLTAMLDRLEEDELVARLPNPEDRRSQLVEVLPAGREVAQKITEEIERFEAGLRRHVTNQDLKGYHAVLTAIADITQVQLRKEKQP